MRGRSDRLLLSGGEPLRPSRLGLQELPGFFAERRRTHSQNRGFRSGERHLQERLLQKGGRRWLAAHPVDGTRIARLRRLHQSVGCLVVRCAFMGDHDFRAATLSCCQQYRGALLSEGREKTWEADGLSRRTVSLLFWFSSKSTCAITFFLSSHSLMLKCWDAEPEERPTFKYCLEVLEALHSEAARNPVPVSGECQYISVVPDGKNYSSNDACKWSSSYFQNCMQSCHLLTDIDAVSNEAYFWTENACSSGKCLKNILHRHFLHAVCFSYFLLENNTKSFQVLKLKQNQKPSNSLPLNPGKPS